MDRTPTEPSTPPVALVDDARAALQRHAWHEAFDLVSKGDAERELTPTELDLLADAAWWPPVMSAATICFGPRLA